MVPRSKLIIIKSCCKQSFTVHQKQKCSTLGMTFEILQVWAKYRTLMVPYSRLIIVKPECKQNITVKRRKRVIYWTRSHIKSRSSFCTKLVPITCLTNFKFSSLSLVILFFIINIAEADLGPCQASMMKIFAKIG